MKKIGIVVFAVAIIIGIFFSSLFSFGRATQKIFNFSFNSGVNGSGNIVTQTRDVSDFTSIDVSSVFEVEIVAQKDFSVEVDADDNLQEFITTTVRRGVLKIESEKRINSKSPIRIRISAPNIERIESSGASKINITELNNSSLDIDTSGVSHIKIEGQTARLKIDVSGAGNIDAANLTAENATVDASGASHVTVNVTNTIRSEASGASSVTYTGNPKQVHKDATGAASIDHK